MVLCFAFPLFSTLLFIIYYVLSEFFLKTSSSPLIIDITIVSFLLLNWILLLLMVNNFFSLVLLIEIITISLFSISASLFIVSSYAYYKQVHNFNLSQIFYFYLLFFWSSTIISVLLFFFLVLYSIWSLNFDFTSILLSLTDLPFFNKLIRFLFLYSILLKLGLPPLFLWKFTFFYNSSIIILIFYNNFFIFFILFFFLRLFDMLVVVDFGSIISFRWLLILITASLFSFIFGFLHNITIKEFVVVSSSINFILLLLVSISSGFSLLNSNCTYILLCFLTLYNWITLVKLLVITREKYSITYFTQFKYIIFKNRFLIFLILLILTGLPLTTGFFFKFSLISFIWKVSNMYVHLIVVFFFFISIVFYFLPVQSILYSEPILSGFREYNSSFISKCTRLLGTQINSLFVFLTILFLIIEDVLVLSCIY